jgi:hypothetical protein
MSKTLAVAVVAALAIGFAGCSGDDDSSGIPPRDTDTTSAPEQTSDTGAEASTAPSAPSAPTARSVPTASTQTTASTTASTGTGAGETVDAAALAAQIGNAMGSLKYFAVISESSIEAGPTSMTVSTEMHMDLTNPAETRATGKVTQMGATVDVIMIGTKIYMRVGTDDWMEVPSDQVNTGTQSNYSESYWKDLLIGGVTKVGTEVVNGVTATHYRAGGGASDGMTITSLDIWVDAAGRCVKNELSASVAQTGADGTMTTTTLFFDFDVPITVEAPI